MKGRNLTQGPENVYLCDPQFSQAYLRMKDMDLESK